MKALTADDFTATRHKVEIPEKDGYVYVKEPSADFILDLLNEQNPDEPIDLKALMPRLIADTVVDEDGQPLFTAETQPSGAMYMRIVNAVMEHSGLKDFSDQVKNSNAAP